MNIQDIYFSSKGRINRLNFFFYYSHLFIILFLLSIIFHATQVTTDSNQLIKWTLFFMLLFLIIYTSSNLTVKRLHDLNKPGKYFFFLFLPIINVYWTFLLFFEKGTNGENKFGPNSTLEVNKGLEKKYFSKQLSRKLFILYSSLSILLLFIGVFLNNYSLNPLNFIDIPVFIFSTFGFFIAYFISNIRFLQNKIFNNNKDVIIYFCFFFGSLFCIIVFDLIINSALDFIKTLSETNDLNKKTNYIKKVIFSFSIPILYSLLASSAYSYARYIHRND